MIHRMVQKSNSTLSFNLLTIHKLKYPLFIILSLLLFISCTYGPAEIDEGDGLMDVNGTKLYYRVVGKGEPILIIHGGPGLGHEYLFNHLAPLAKEYQLIFYDQRISGKSSLNVSPKTVTLDNYIEDIEGLRMAFGIKRLNIMAHSWGGLLAMKYAVAFPQHTKSLILVNSVGASSAVNVDAKRVIAKRATSKDSLDRINIVRSEEFQRQEISAVESLMLIGYRHQFHNPELLDSLHLSLTADYFEGSRLMHNLGRDIANFDFHPDLAKIKSPSLIIYGDYDPSADFAGKKLDESIPNSKLIIIDDCGHFPFIEKQEEFIELVTEFMQENS